VTFAGFGGHDAGSNVSLSPAEWIVGAIVFTPDQEGYGIAFDLPTHAILRGVSVTVATPYEDVVFESGSTARPFACVAVSDTTNNLVYTILKESLTYTEPYTGGVTYPTHTLRRGELKNLNIPIAEGTLVALIVGTVGENVTTEHNLDLAVSAGLLFEWA